MCAVNTISCLWTPICMFLIHLVGTFPICRSWKKSVSNFCSCQKSVVVWDEIAPSWCALRAAVASYQVWPLQHPCYVHRQHTDHQSWVLKLLVKGKQRFPPAYLPAVVSFKAIVEKSRCVGTVHAHNSVVGLDNVTYLLPWCLFCHGKIKVNALVPRIWIHWYFPLLLWMVLCYRAKPVTFGQEIPNE